MEKTIRFFKFDEGINAGWYADVPTYSGPWSASNSSLK